MATGWHMLLGGLPLAALSLAREGSELAPRLQQLTGQHLMLVTQLNVCLGNGPHVHSKLPQQNLAQLDIVAGALLC